MKPKRKLKQSVKLILLFILGIIAFMLIGKLVANSHDDFYQKCDEHYGYTTDYYTCFRYHNPSE